MPCRVSGSSRTSRKVSGWQISRQLLARLAPVILRDLFRTRATGAENVLGAIWGYLIAGAAWGRINAITYLLIPSAYSINPEITTLLPD